MSVSLSCSVFHTPARDFKKVPGILWDKHAFWCTRVKSGNIKKYLGEAGIENKNYSAHSLRSGFATVSAESGADERSIMAMTGHKTTQMVRRYIKEANIFKNNALNRIKI